jgi:glycosyltransferase involved in cell wall biosynthesis
MNYQVTCVCGGCGFPISATGARIIMVGRALQESNIKFQVLHCGPTPSSINSQASGCYDGISFRYTTPLKRPENWILRRLMYAWGLIGLTSGLVRLWPKRRSSVVYLYVMDGLLNCCVGLLCQLLGLAVIQELCEWVPAHEEPASRFDVWLYRKRIFKVATGVLVISTAIEERVRTKYLSSYPDVTIHRTPVLVHARRFAQALASSNREESTPTFVYCGTFLKDVFFVIDAFALVRRGGLTCKLMIIGECGARMRGELLEYSKGQGLSPDDIILAGFVDERTLDESYKASAGLLMPLWDDEKSITRLPNKMGEYLASGRPVITCEVGDLRDCLKDNVNAYVGEPGDKRAFADSMIAVLEDPDRATRIGALGQKTCFEYFDYRAHSRALTRFVIRCIERRNERRAGRKDELGIFAAAPPSTEPETKDDRIGWRQ